MIENKDKEIIQCWLSKIHFDEYANHFINAGYDMPTISRMTPEDLTAIGITKPNHRRILKAEIQRLCISDGIPNFKPTTLLEWLKLLHLEDYYNVLCEQGYDTVDRVTELAWEDLEEVGITKLGHQKKIMLAIKRIQNVNNYSTCSPINESKSAICSSTDTPPQASTNNYHLPIQPQYQDVPIKMFAPTKLSPSPTIETPITTQLKTFQQLPANNMHFMRQISEGSNCGFAPNEGQPYFQSSRGRSLESLDNCESNFYQMYGGLQQRHPLSLTSKQFFDNEIIYSRENEKVGYETDSELFNGYNGVKKYYEIDGTATLHRPKGLIKAKPIAKIAAKTRHIESNAFNSIYSNELKKSTANSLLYETRNVPSSDNSVQSNQLNGESNCASNDYLQDMSKSQIYSSLMRKKTPPPPPKRVNSMRNSANNCVYYGVHSNHFNSSNSNRDNYDEFQEQVFATCVKSLTSRFSMNDCEELNACSKNFDNDFPPPPSPLLYTRFNNKESYNALQTKKDNCDRECNISNSSSTESMPFANDNIGTIKQRVSLESSRNIHSPSLSYSSTSTSSSSSLASSSSLPTAMINHKFNSLSSPVSPNDQFANIVPAVDHLDDIETMLANLSDQLDLMLENENHKS